MINQNQPTYPVILASCDSVYFIEHAVAFCMSCSENNHDVHVNIINPNDEVKQLCQDIAGACKTKFTFSYEEYDLTNYTEEGKRSFYASSRFRYIPNILDVAKKVLILDIDSLVMKPFDFPEKYCGYFPRDDEPLMEMKVAAGAVYLTEEAYDVAMEIIAQLSGFDPIWFADQVSLYHAFPLDAERFDNNFLDWEFSESSCIWTGKGDRKYNNQKYLEKKKYYNALLS